LHFVWQQFRALFALVLRTTFPPLAYPLGPISVFDATIDPDCGESGESGMGRRRQRTLEEEKTVTGTQRIGTCGIVTVGVLSSGVALLSSRLDRALFCVLSSGSMLLALTIASTSLDLFFRGLVRLGDRQPEKSAVPVSEPAAAPGSNGMNSLQDPAAAASVGD
jgi:hypothetical protein